MPRKGENIYKRKDGRWEGRYIRSYDSEHKAKYAYVYGKTYSEVKRKLTEQRGNVQKVQPTKNKSSTYGELLDCWLHSMQLNTKESTQARYTHLIKTHIKPHLGAVQLSQLTTDAIEIFIEQQLTDGRLDNSGGLSPKTVTDILTIIKSTIEYARYKELPVICNLSKLSIKKKEKEMRVFTPSEQESLIGTLTNDMDHSKFGVLLSLYTGIRVGELCALQWEDFDLAHSKLKIRKTMQRIQDLGNGSVSKTKIVITEPKSQCSIREIPLPLFIVDVAKKFASNPKAYILTGTDRYIEPRTMQNRFKSYVKECNVEPANFHVLRHTFATRCVEVGFEVKSLSEVLGHANVNITLAEQYQSETGTPDSILEDAETLQELSLAAERAKKLLSAKEKAPVAVNYMGERVRVELTREKFDDGLLDVRQAVIQDIPSSRCDYLFDEVRRKEGLAEKLGGFFHKK